MFTSLAAAVILSCKPYYHPPMPPPPPTTTACEGSDQVRRNHDGLEVSRAMNASRCMPSTASTPVVVRPQHDALRYGLSYR